MYVYIPWTDIPKWISITGDKIYVSSQYLIYFIYLCLDIVIQALFALFWIIKVNMHVFCHRQQVLYDNNDFMISSLLQTFTWGDQEWCDSPKYPAEAVCCTAYSCSPQHCWHLSPFPRSQYIVLSVMYCRSPQNWKFYMTTLAISCKILMNEENIFTNKNIKWWTKVQCF